MAVKKPVGGSKTPPRKTSTAKPAPKVTVKKGPNTTVSKNAAKFSSAVQTKNKLVAAGKQTEKETASDRRQKQVIVGGLSMLPAGRAVRGGMAVGKAAVKGVKAAQKVKKTSAAIKKSNAAMKKSNEEWGKFNNQMKEWDSPKSAVKTPSYKYKGKDPARITPQPFKGSKRTTPKPDKKPGSTKGYVQRKRGEDF